MNKETPLLTKWISAFILLGILLAIIWNLMALSLIEELDIRDIFRKSLIIFFQIAAVVVIFRSKITMKTFLTIFSGFAFFLISSLCDLSEEFLHDGSGFYEFIEDFGEPFGLLFILIGLYLWLDERNHLAKLRYNLAKETGRIGVWEWQLKTQSFLLDQETYKILGYRQDELSPKKDTLKRLIDTNDIGGFRKAINLHFKDHTTAFEKSIKLKKKNGHYGLFLLRGKAQFDQHNKPYKVLGTITDITERIDIENKLKQSEQNYRLLAENSTDVIATFDNDLNIQYVSPSVFKLFGYTQEEIREMDLNKIVSPDSYSSAILAYNQLVRDQLKHGHPIDETRLHLSMISKSGSKILVEFVIMPMRNDDNEHIGFLTTSRKISTKNFENRLQKSSTELFSRYFHLNPLPMCLVKLSNGIYTDANQAFLEALGFNKQELIGKTSEELATWYNQHERLNFIKSILKHNRLSDFKMTYMTKKGRVRLARLTAERIFYQNEAQLLLVAKDITNQTSESMSSLRIKQTT